MIRQEFMVERSGKQFALYSGLLDEAHSQGLSSILTQLLQIPTEANGNTAIVQATVTTEKGSFQGIGDASPGNVTRAMAGCLIRLAETRAKARALRDAVNVGVACLEELSGQEETPAAVPAIPAAIQPPVESPATPMKGMMTTAQRRMIETLAQQVGQKLDTEKLEQLTSSQAAGTITRLKEKLAEQAASKTAA